MHLIYLNIRRLRDTTIYNNHQKISSFRTDTQMIQHKHNRSITRFERNKTISNIE